MADAWGKAMQAMADDMNRSDTVEAEVLDDQEPSDAAKTNGTVVHQTIVNQYGDHPVHIDHVENLNFLIEFFQNSKQLVIVFLSSHR